jgi:DNA-binding transcriptional ArsR family regulator
VIKRFFLKEPVNWVGILKVLADDTRLQIIRQLLLQESSVNTLSRVLGIEIYNMSKHLKILEAHGLIEKRKEGIHRIYKITAALRSRLSNDNLVLDLGCCVFKFSDLEK